MSHKWNKAWKRDQIKFNVYFHQWDRDGIQNVNRANLYFGFDLGPRFEFLLLWGPDLSIFTPSPLISPPPSTFSVDFLSSGTTIDNWIFAVSNPIYFALNTKT